MNLINDINDFMNNQNKSQFTLFDSDSDWKYYKYSYLLLCCADDPFHYYKYITLYVYDPQSNRRVIGINEIIKPLPPILSSYTNILVTISP